MRVAVIPIIDWSARYGSQRLGKRPGRVRNRKKCRDHPNYSITKNCQDTEKSPRDLRRLAVTHSSERPSANAGIKNSQKSKNNNN